MWLWANAVAVFLFNGLDGPRAELRARGSTLSTPGPVRVDTSSRKHDEDSIITDIILRHI